MLNEIESATASPFPLRVLIADDNQETRRATRLMLSEISGIKVVAIAHDGQEAVQQARRHRPDIIIMDVNMPGIGGLEAVQRITQRDPKTACIIISTERERKTLERAMQVGARDYLIKPFTSEQLMIALRRISQVVTNNQRKFDGVDELRQERDRYLNELAEEYVRQRRTDDKALAVFEQLAANPECQPRWLHTLAMLYVLRRRWSSLKELAERLE